MTEITKQAGISLSPEIKEDPQNYKRFMEGFKLDLSKSFPFFEIEYEKIFTDEERVDGFLIKKKGGELVGQIRFHELSGVEIKVEENKNFAHLKKTVEKITERREEKIKKKGLMPDIRR